MKGYSRNYDVIVVGGGPAGAFFAYEMLQRYPDKQILLIERGKRVEKRFCPANDEKGNGKCVKCKPHCNITNGFSGAYYRNFCAGLQSFVTGLSWNSRGNVI